MNEKRKKEIRVLAMEKELKENRIRLLASQMQPHFLYNTLSSIQEIVLFDPDYASSLIGDFTTYLRGCIKSMNSDQLIPFAQELANIKAYVHIEEIRFADRLKIFYEIQTENFMVVPLGIQPLVENAIRHGIFGRGPEGGTVWIQSFEEQGFHVVRVKDDGVGFSTETLGNLKGKDAQGLQNLMFRLEKCVQGTLDIKSVVGVGTEATIRIPMRKRKAETRT